jgi:hypothetical protein
MDHAESLMQWMRPLGNAKPLEALRLVEGRQDANTTDAGTGD